MNDVPNARPARPYRRALPWLVAGLLLATIGLPSVAALGTMPVAPAVGVARPLALTENLSVNLTDRPSFDPAALSVPSNSSVSIHLVNVGNYSHTFTLSAKSGAVIPPTLSPSELYSYFRANGSLANVSLAPGGQGWANLTLNASTGLDSFEFVSVVPYQFQAGMAGLLNVTSSGPGLLLSENATNSLSFDPNVLSSTPTHYPINLDVLVTNEGSFPHTFTVAPQSNVTLTPGNFTAYFQQHAPLVNVNVPAVGGGTVWANFTVAKPGIYEYICEISGHFQSGMFGFLYVGVSPPAPPAAPSTAVVESWVLAGSAVLLAVGGVLVLVATYTGRLPHRTGGHHGHP